jgi:alpha-L-fucosidase
MNLTLLRALTAVAALAASTIALASDTPPNYAQITQAAKDARDNAKHVIAPGPFSPTWQSLEKGYQCPDWFRNAKFGIWAHWTAQCVPEQGDWYARSMYMEGNPDYKYQLAHYGHPSKFGFKDIDNLWHAEHWDPEKLMQLYVAAGAHYFMALANHHDNFDCYDSKYQPWNSVNVGPHQDIVGTWAKVARKYGLPFGVSNHSSHAWHWFQVAYSHDLEGPLKGIPYDGVLTQADGKGLWWDGLDPQDLYCGLRLPMPDNITTPKAAEDWHKKNDGHWYEDIPPNDNGYAEKWFLRTQDLLDKYHPDMLYFDDTQLPLGQKGLDIVTHFYNASIAWNGKNQAVVEAKQLTPDQRRGIVEDYERGLSDDIKADPWQTDTCIGQWHYRKGIKYKSVSQVVQMLCDIVSKNGNLMLNIPVRGDGTIDDDEVTFLKGMAAWMEVNKEGIFDTRPWTVFGEGPPKAKGGMFNEGKMKYSAADIRFTTKGDNTLYAYFLGWPKDGKLTIHALSKGATPPGPLDKDITSLTLLGSDAKIPFTRDADGLHVDLPGTAPSEGACALKLQLQ